MVDETAQEWFLEIEEKKTGPFPTEQILGLLADREIPDSARIQASTPGSEWITVRELAERTQRGPTAEPPAPVLAPAPAKPFVPPPRPADLHPTGEITRPGAAGKPTPPVVAEAIPENQRATSKPEFSLLDALLAAKERKSHASRAVPPDGESPLSNPFDLKNIPQKVWMMAGTAVVLCVAAWGMAHFIKQKKPSLATNTDAPEISRNIPPPPVPYNVPPITPGLANTTAPVPPPAARPANITPPNPAAAAPVATVQNTSDTERERDRERERQLERDRDRDRDREIANEGTPPPAAAPPPYAPGGEAIPPPPGGAAMPVTPGMPVMPGTPGGMPGMPQMTPGMPVGVPPPPPESGQEQNTAAPPVEAPPPPPLPVE